MPFLRPVLPALALLSAIGVVHADYYDALYSSLIVRAS